MNLANYISNILVKIYDEDYDVIYGRINTTIRELMRGTNIRNLSHGNIWASISDILTSEGINSDNPLGGIIELCRVKKLSAFLFGHVEQTDENITRILPRRSTYGSAGYDIYSNEDIIIAPGDSYVFKTGLNVLLSPDKVLLVVPRSGLGFKYHAQLANTIGVIDSDYTLSDNRGHIMIKIVNNGNNILTINKGMAFAQGICVDYNVTLDDANYSKKTRNGGFGSTSDNNDNRVWSVGRAPD